VNHAVSSVSTTPILENILIKVTFDAIILTSNNLETAIEYKIIQNIEIFSE
jgi:DNA polymerase III sliding clamp (beta) subunit (PCNA family)